MERHSTYVDPLAPVRGVLVGVALGATAWSVLIGVALFVLR